MTHCTLQIYLLIYYAHFPDASIQTRRPSSRGANPHEHALLIDMPHIATEATAVAPSPALAPGAETGGTVSDKELTSLPPATSTAQNRAPREVCNIRGRASRVRGHAEADDDDDSTGTRSDDSLVMRLRWNGSRWYVMPFKRP